VSAALKHAGTGEIVEFELPQPEGPVGLKAWVAAHKAARPGNEALQKQVSRWQASERLQQLECCTLTLDWATPKATNTLPHRCRHTTTATQLDEWVEAHEAAEAAKRAAQQAAMAEDGWTVVTRDKVGGQKLAARSDVAHHKQQQQSLFFRAWGH
jgi:hypothetical protein